MKVDRSTSNLTPARESDQPPTSSGVHSMGRSGERVKKEDTPANASVRLQHTNTPSTLPLATSVYPTLTTSLVGIPPERRRSPTPAWGTIGLILVSCMVRRSEAQLRGRYGVFEREDYSQSVW